jgi:uncharacterized membrane protein (UPF0127 family)
MKLNLVHQGKVVARDVVLANTFWTRLSGYMFRRVPHHAGILFEPCQALQTTFMFFDLDVLFLDREGRVLKVIRRLRPWRHTWFYFKAKYALEVPAGGLPESVREGDVLELQHV